MRGRSGVQSLLILLLVSFALFGSTLVGVHPVDASPDPGTLDFHPTAHVETGGLIGEVTTPTNAYDKDSSSYADFLFGTKPAGSFNLTTFEVGLYYYDYPSTTIEGNVTFNMRYSASASDNEPYRILYYVSPSTVPTVLQDWNLLGDPLDPLDVWPDQPKPDNTAWTWTDVQNIKFVVETAVVVGGADKAPFYLYEAWVSVPCTPLPTTLYVQPPSIIDYGLTPEPTKTIRPTADSSAPYNGWTGDYTDWDETVQNGDTDYVSATTYMLTETSQLQDVSPHPSYTIANVRVVAYARTDIATDEELVFVVVIDGTKYWADYPTWPYPGYTLTTTYEKYSWDWGKNPHTEDYWTWSDIDALEAGVESQVSLDYVWTGEMRVTQLYVEVEGPRLTVDVEVSNVKNLWGYTVLLGYDTTILTATSYTSSNPFTSPWPSEINDEISTVAGEEVGTGDGETTDFLLAHRPVISGSDTVYLDEVEQTRDVDYTIDYKAGKITFTTAPDVEVSITADYQYAAYVSVTYSKPPLTPGENTGLPYFNMSLLQIAFLVEGLGATDLDLHDTKLSDPPGEIISHVSVDGYFKNQIAVPEFPLGMVMELSVIVAIIYVWWKRRKKTKILKYPI